MPALIASIIAAVRWVVIGFTVRWAVAKIFWIGLFTIVLPWVLKDGVNWLWNAMESRDFRFLDYINDFLGSALGGMGFEYNINLPHIAGYLATHTGFTDYFYIVISGWGICFAIKVLGKIF